LKRAVWNGTILLLILKNVALLVKKHFDRGKADDGSTGVMPVFAGEV
jgi:hypothetical protein